MNDDELRELLRSEVPQPQAGYWRDIEERLARASEEGEPGNTPEEFDSSTHTDDNVVRLIDMTQTQTPSTSTTTAWRIAAIAAASVLLAGLAFVLTRDDSSPSGLDTADTPSTASVPSTSTTDATGSVPTDSTGDPSTSTPVVSDADPSVWWATGAGEIQARVEPGPDAAVSYAVLPGSEVHLGTGRVADVDGVEWVEMVARGQQDPVWLPADRLDRLGDRLPSVEPAIVVFTADMVNLREYPSLDAPVVSQIDIDTTLPRSGERAFVDGREWVELDAGEERPFTWVAAEFVSFIDGEGVGPESVGGLRECYSDGDIVLFLDFSVDATTFTGGLSYLDSVEAFSGTRDEATGTRFDVYTAPVGSGEGSPGPVSTQEQWEVSAEAMNVGDRVLLPWVDCTDVSDAVAEIEQLVYLDV